MSIGKPIRHPDLPAMTVSDEVVRLLIDAVGDASGAARSRPAPEIRHLRLALATEGPNQ